MAKQKVEDKVAQLAEPLTQEFGLELVDVEFVKEGGSWYLRVFIDKEIGVELEDCEKVSKALDKKLDEIDPIAQAYHLEISSPGLDRPLKKEQDFLRFIGSQINVTTYTSCHGKKKFTGELLGLEDGIVQLLEKDGQKKEIPREQIAKARLVVEF